MNKKICVIYLHVCQFTLKFDINNKQNMSNTYMYIHISIERKYFEMLFLYIITIQSNPLKFCMYNIIYYIHFI